MSDHATSNRERTGQSPGEVVVPTLCGACHNNCGILVHVADGTITGIEGNPDHPFNRGMLCAKGPCMHELVTSPHRIRQPLLRVGERGERKWREITWDEALDLTARKLTEIRQKYGPETLLKSTGAPVLEFQRWAFIEFFARYGTPNIFSSNLCSGPLTMALESVYGFKSQPDYRATNLIIMWGGNPWASMRPGHNIAYDEGGFLSPIPNARKRGAKFVVIDPVCTETAAKADWWISLRPGTDGALALAMLHVIINRGLYDTGFVEEWTVGFEQLKDHVQPCTPEWAQEITGIPAADIRKLAMLYGTTKPAVIRWGNTFANHTNVTQALRAGGCLEAITGNLEIPGGDLCYPGELRYTTTVKPKGTQLGAERYPLIPAGPSILDAFFTGKPYLPRALLAYHTNFVSHAGYTRVREALRKLEFIAVIELFRTRTCEDLADLILPAASFLEMYDWRSYPSTQGLIVALRRPAIAPVHSSRPIYEIERDLAGRMGYGDTYPWHTLEELYAYHLASVGLDLEKLRQDPIQVVKRFEYRKHEKGLLRRDGRPGFNTPSGKIELYSARFEELGYEPLPTYREPAESPVSTSEVAKQYPLIAVNRRSPYYVHYKFRNLPSLRKIEPDPVVRLHPTDALTRGISEGAWVKIRSPRGEIRMKAHVTERTRLGVAWIDGGWGNPWDFEDANVNVLADNQKMDPAAQCASIASFLCEVVRE